jgi:hypothetical protein
VAAAAQLLGLSRKTLYDKLHRLRIALPSTPQAGRPGPDDGRPGSGSA